MNPKNTFLLVLVTAGLFAFIWLYERHLHKPVTGPNLVFPNFNTNAISSIQIHLAQQLEIRVARTNNAWQLTEPLNYPARAEAIEDLLQTVTDLAPQTFIPAQVLKNRRSVDQDYGFLNPQATLTFQQGDDERTLILGDLTPPGDQIYAQVVGVDHVDILDADFFKKIVPHDFNDWRDTAFINCAVRAFNRLTVSYGTQTHFELDREKTNLSWQMSKPVFTRADGPKIESLLFDLQALRVAHFVTDDPQADLETYGLAPAALELQFAEGTNAVLTLQFGKSPTNDAKQVYARCNGQNAIVRVLRAPVAAWLDGFQSFRDRHLVRLAGEAPAEIDVSTPREKFAVVHESGSTWRVAEPVVFMADTNLMGAFISNLVNLEVVVSSNGVAVKDAVLPDSDFPVYGLANPSRRYLLKRNAPEGASNAVIAELDFGLAKDGKVFARRGDLADETSVYAVKQEDFEKLPASSLSLRDRQIWNFTADQVGSITVRQNGKDMRLIHAGTNHWIIATNSQGSFNNELEIEVGADELGLLAAQDWIKSGDDDRAKYGFSEKSPRITVEVKIGGKPEMIGTNATFTVDFGGWSPEGFRYGDVKMADGQNWIFEFSTVQYDRLAAYLNISDGRAP